MISDFRLQIADLEYEMWQSIEQRAWSMGKDSRQIAAGSRQRSEVRRQRSDDGGKILPH
jgi:hypothetical protein